MTRFSKINLGIIVLIVLVMWAVPDILANTGNNNAWRTLRNGLILVYSTQTNGPGGRADFDEDLPATLINSAGYQVTVEDRSTMPILTVSILANYAQLWIISTETDPVFTQDEIQTVVDFHNSGGSILFICDGSSYDGPVNQFYPYFNVSTGVGDYNHCDSCCAPASGFTPHLLWEYVTDIQANASEGNLVALFPAQVIANHNGINMVAVRDADGGRVVWDATWYRFYDASAHPFLNITRCNNASYVVSIAHWLGPSQDWPDSANFHIIYGNKDGSVLNVSPGDTIEIQCWGATDPTPGNPDSVTFIHNPLMSNDDIVTARLSGTFPDTLVGFWDDRLFLSPDNHNNDQNVPYGFTNQSMLGFAYTADPRDKQNFFYTFGDTVLICTFLMTITSDSQFLGQTVCPFVEGHNQYNGPLWWEMIVIGGPKVYRI